MTPKTEASKLDIGRHKFHRNPRWGGDVRIAIGMCKRRRFIYMAARDQPPLDWQTTSDAIIQVCNKPIQAIQNKSCGDVREWLGDFASLKKKYSGEELMQRLWRLGRELIAEHVKCSNEKAANSKKRKLSARGEVGEPEKSLGLPLSKKIAPTEKTDKQRPSIVAGGKEGHSPLPRPTSKDLLAKGTPPGNLNSSDPEVSDQGDLNDTPLGDSDPASESESDREESKPLAPVRGGLAAKPGSLAESTHFQRATICKDPQTVQKLKSVDPSPSQSEKQAGKIDAIKTSSPRHKEKPPPRPQTQADPRGSQDKAQPVSNPKPFLSSPEAWLKNVVEARMAQSKQEATNEVKSSMSQSFIAQLQNQQRAATTESTAAAMEPSNVTTTAASERTMTEKSITIPGGANSMSSISSNSDASSVWGPSALSVVTTTFSPSAAGYGMFARTKPESRTDAVEPLLAAKGSPVDPTAALKFSPESNARAGKIDDFIQRLDGMKAWWLVQKERLPASRRSMLLVSKTRQFDDFASSFKDGFEAMVGNYRRDLDALRK